MHCSRKVPMLQRLFRGVLQQDYRLHESKSRVYLPQFVSYQIRSVTVLLLFILILYFRSTIGYCNAYQLDDSFTLNCPYGCASRQCLCSSTNCINGDCTSIGICRCNSGWTGPNCGLLIGSTPALNAVSFEL